MPQRVQDEWARWVLDRPGDVLLDVGAGDGLIAFGALDLLGPTGHVIFSDVSRDLVNHGQNLAEELGVSERCSFVRTSADDLAEVDDSSVDVVTTRSVLIYLPSSRKQNAFHAFHRVLRPAGRFSLFEPINRFAHPEPDDVFWGFDVAPVIEIARKVKQIYKQDGAPDSTLGDFDERHLLEFAENAGFSSICLHYEAEISPGTWFTSWDAFLDTSGNPLIPTQREAIDRALTPREAERFEAHLRPLVERGEAINRSASAYLFGQKE